MHTIKSYDSILVSGLRIGLGAVISVHCTEVKCVSSKYLCFYFSFVDTLILSSILLAHAILLRIDFNCFMPAFTSFPLVFNFVRSNAEFLIWSSSTTHLQRAFIMLLNKCMLLGKMEGELGAHAVSVQ